MDIPQDAMLSQIIIGADDKGHDVPPACDGTMAGGLVTLEEATGLRYRDPPTRCRCGGP